MSITADTMIEDLVRDYPFLVRPLSERNLVCIACGEPLWGTLGELAQSKGIENFTEILAELNQIVAQQGKQ